MNLSDIWGQVSRYIRSDAAADFITDWINLAQDDICKLAPGFWNSVTQTLTLSAGSSGPYALSARPIAMGEVIDLTTGVVLHGVREDQVTFYQTVSAPVVYVVRDTSIYVYAAPSTDRQLSVSYYRLLAPLVNSTDTNALTELAPMAIIARAVGFGLRYIGVTGQELADWDRLFEQEVAMLKRLDTLTKDRQR
jgi:hypothetical protein